MLYRIQKRSGITLVAVFLLAMAGTVQGTSANTGTAEAYIKQAQAFMDTGRSGDARRLYEQALRETEALGQNNPKLPEVMVEVAEFYQQIKDFHRAENLYLKAINYKIRLLGREHEDIAALYHRLGRIYFGEGELGQANEYFQKALTIYTDKLERDSNIQFVNKRKVNLAIADVLDDIARTIIHTKGRQEADLLYAKAGRIRANPNGTHY